MSSVALPRWLRPLAVSVLAVAVGCTDAPLDDAVVPPAPLDPCATADFVDDGARLPAKLDAGAFSLSWESASPLERGRANFCFTTSSDVESVGLIAALLAREHDAFVPAEREIPVEDGGFETTFDLYLEGPWELIARGFDANGDATEEVRFAFCVAP